MNGTKEMLTTVMVKRTFFGPLALHEINCQIPKGHGPEMVKKITDFGHFLFVRFLF